jgi:hypothetical protein
MAYAFHSGGVASAKAATACTPQRQADMPAYWHRCWFHLPVLPHERNRHRSEATMSAPQMQNRPWLVSLQRNPGGDFGWLKKTYSWVSVANPDGRWPDPRRTISLQLDFNYFADTRFPTSPGGHIHRLSSAALPAMILHGKGRLLWNGQYAFTGGAIIGSGSCVTVQLPVLAEEKR